MTELKPILVVNRKAWDGNGTYIGRGGVFGNPYTHLPLEKTNAEIQVPTREDSIRMYEEHAKKMWVEDAFFKICLTSLVREYLSGEQIVLACNCKPKACHGDVLKKLIEDMAEYGVVTLEDAPF